MLDLLSAIAVSLTVVAAAMAGWNTVTKFRARRDLSRAVRSNAIDLHELNDQLDAKNFDAALAVIRKHIATLPPAEQREAESALTQPSAAGRAGYMRGIAAQREASPHSL